MSVHECVSEGGDEIGDCTICLQEMKINHYTLRKIAGAPDEPRNIMRGEMKRFHLGL